MKSFLFTTLKLSLLVFAMLGVGCASETSDPQPSSEQTSQDALRKGHHRLGACPPVAQPMCAAGTVLTSRVDASGCTFFSCDKQCPEIDVPSCNGGEVITGTDESGCAYAYCKPSACLPIAPPFCDQGTKLVERIDAQGCPSFACEK